MGGDERQRLLDSIRGQTVLMPNLRPIFGKWSGKINPNYQVMIPVVNERLESLIPNEKKLAKLKTADFALFASNWWPKANFNELRIVTFLAIWLFLWDDELDEPTGEYSDNFETAQKYRKETVQFLRDCLRLDEKRPRVGSYYLLESFRGFGLQLKATLDYYLGLKPSKNSHSPATFRILHGLQIIGEKVKNTLAWTFGRSATKTPSTASHPMIESFRVIGEALSNAYTIEQRQNFYEELEFYISTTETEQKFHLDGRIPSLEEYWAVRMGTSAVGACLAVIEFAHGIRGSYANTNESSLKAMCDEANIIVIIANDMLSLKKEIVLGCIDSLIPLSCPKYGNVQNALDQAHTDLLVSVARFESEAEQILSGPNTTKMSDAELRTFVAGARECWVGNLNWSLCTGRYGLGSIDQKNGSFLVVL